MKGILILFISTSLMGCKSKKDVAQTSEERKDTVELRVVDSEWRTPEYNVPVQVTRAMIDRNTLTVMVEFSGGCEEHEFELVTNKLYKKSMPPQLDIILVHNGHGDNCRMLVQKTLQFDISAAQYPSENTKEVILVIRNGEEAVQRLNYAY